MKRTVSENISNKSHNATEYPQMRPYLTSFLWIIVALLISAGFAQAQSDQSNVRFTQGDVSDNNQLSLGVPLASYKGRGIDLPISLSYSADVWKIEHLGALQIAPPGGYSCCVTQSVTEAIYAKDSASGWKSSLTLPIIEFPKSDVAYDYKGKSVAYPAASCFNFRIPEVYIHMPDGSTHTLRKSDQPSNSGSVDMSGDFYAIDGSRIRFTATGVDTGTIYTPDGTRYVLAHPESQIIDRNGNYITYDEEDREWTDIIGRVIANPLPATPTVGRFEYALPGLSGSENESLSYTFKWEELEDALTPVGGSAPSLRVIGSEYLPNPTSPPAGSPGYGNVPATQSLSHARLFQSVLKEDDPNNPNYARVPTLIVGHNQSANQLFNPVVLSEIILPDGTSYKFTYNVYGEIDKVVYPTGAYEKYEYTGPDATPTAWDQEGDDQPYLQGLRHLSSRKQSEDGAGDDLLEWTYAGGPTIDGGGGTSTVNPDGTMVSIFRYGPGNKYYDSVKNIYYYRFGDKDPRVNMIASKTFDSAPVGGVRTMLRREIYAYDAHDSYSTEYSVTCTLGSTSTTRQFPMRRAARLARQTNIIFEGSGDALAQSATFSYDTTYEMSTGMDQTYADVRDYVVLSNSTAQTAAIGDISLGTRLKYTDTTYSSNSTYRSANILGLPETVTVKNNAGTVLSRSEMIYDDCPDLCTSAGAALPTILRTWDSSKGVYTNSSAYLITKAKFDGDGNRIEATDAMNNVTTTAYDSTYNAYPVSVISPAPGNSTYGSSSGFTTSSTYDTTTGLVLSTTDINSQTTTMEYNDALLRPTKVTAPNGFQTVSEYGPGGANPDDRWIKVKTQTDESNWCEVKSFYDGLGRIYKNKKSDSEGDIFTETEYDDMGRAKRSTDPYRTGETKRWTAPTYDDLSRTKKVTSPDSNEVNVVFGLSTSGVIGTTKTITDQAGKKRKGIVDALGNMVRVIEDPDSQNLATDYVFDLMGNLRKTTQEDQVRYFSYDSLGRLLRARQIEQTVNTSLALSSIDPITGNNSWTVGYEYDDNGNITSTTDAKNVSISVTYDHLNRLTYRNYSDSTPDVTFYYDGTGLGSVPNYSKGKTTKVTSSVSENKFTSFDSMGRLLASQQITDGQTYSFGYAYDLSGGLIEETYPSGRVVKNTLNQDGEVTQVQSKKNSSAGFWTYADAITRNSAGAIIKLQLGNGHWETASYNERQQVTQIGLGKLDNTQDLLKLEFKYNTTGNSDNNGSMLEQKITVPAVGGTSGFTATQSYTYDSLNRIQSATESVPGVTPPTWKQTFSYDRYGNRRFNTTSGATTTLGSCPQIICNPTVSTSTNRIDDSYYVYDANGNLTEDAYAWEFAYDAENRQVEVKDDEDTVKGTYFYDGEGKRVKKISSSETTLFVYDARGQLGAEYSTALASTPQVSYLTADHLGSARAITNENGAVVNRKDFSAFGEETHTSQRTAALGYTDAEDRNIRQDYAGYKKDEESGLEYAEARYYNPGHGRFTSVDPMTSSVELNNPQTFNRFAYVVNNPYKFVDPLGLALQDIGVFQTYDGSLAAGLDFNACQQYKQSVNEEFLNARAIANAITSTVAEIQGTDDTETTTVLKALLDILTNGTNPAKVVAANLMSSKVTIDIKDGMKSSGEASLSDVAGANAAIKKGGLTVEEALKFITISIDRSMLESQPALQANLVHEGTHAMIQATVLSSLSTGNPKKYQNETGYNDELRATTAAAEYLKARGGDFVKYGQLKGVDHLDANGNVNNAYIQGKASVAPIKNVLSYFQAVGLKWKKMLASY